MKNLMKADFMRLIKYKPFLIIGGILILFSLYLNFGFNVNMKNDDFYYIRPFEYFVYISFITSTFVSFFAGINFTDGVIRNKLFCGHSKAKIYFSNAIICAFASLVFTVIHMLGGIWVVANGKIDVPSFFVFCFVSIIVSISFSAIASFCTFIIKGKAIPIVASALIIIGMFVATNRIGEALSEPEYTEVIDTVDGEEVGTYSVVISGNSNITYKKVENPYYIPDGAKRTTLETVFKLLPTSNLYYSTTIVLSSDSPEKVQALTSDFDQADISCAKDVLDSTNVLYNFITLAVFTLAGVYIFRKENLQ